MGKINRKSRHHHGTYPVRVLQHNVIAEFENILRSSGDQMHLNIIELGELSRGIRYFMDDRKIRDISWINREVTQNEDGTWEEYDYIHIHENYIQMIWSISYAMLVAVDQHPVGSGVGRETDEYLDAVRVFSTGVSLLFEYDLQRMRTLPNPEEYEESVQKYVENANGVMLFAATFVLLHEAGHHHYGHTGYISSDEQSMVDEYAADEFAFDLFMGMTEKEKRTAFLGILVALICIVLKDGNRGGDRHPKPLSRLVNLLMKMDEKQNSLLWLYTFVALYLWLVDYGKRWGIDIEIPMLSTGESWYDNYQRILEVAIEVGDREVHINEKGYLRYEDLI